MAHLLLKFRSGFPGLPGNPSMPSGRLDPAELYLSRSKPNEADPASGGYPKREWTEI